ncbi:MAG TPA: ATP-binding protein, partial [Gammaproteobacteria bacterium]|nr:ATP-binding protein [Gammaproteobacteria bacterium]
TNAVNYGGEGGSIALLAETDPCSPEWVTARVRDDGVGIPQGMLETIFELFAQADMGDRRGHKGLGIGLALVRALTELHGGTICAKSEGPGRGSEFVLRLPVTRRRPRTVPAPARHRTAGPLRALRVLIVDDNVDWARGVAMYLTETSQHEVTVAHTGCAGVEAAVDGQCEVVLLDVGLPDIDGYEVIRRLRSRLGERAPPVIGISGYGSRADRERAGEAGFARYFVKPVAYETIDEALEQLAPAPSADLRTSLP